MVTGAGSGIGKAAAIAYAKAGATVILLGKTVSKLEAVYDEIESAGCPEAAITPVDLESVGDHEYEKLVAGIDREYGRLDGLLNNAGYMGPTDALPDHDTGALEQGTSDKPQCRFCINPILLSTSAGSRKWLDCIYLFNGREKTLCLFQRLHGRQAWHRNTRPGAVS